MSSAFTPKVRWLIINRDTDEHGTTRCQWCGRPVRVPGGFNIQHRRSRNMGGSRLKDTGQAQNGVIVCPMGQCHSHIESHPVEAAERGFRIRQGDNPASIPVRTWDGRLLFLTVDGRAVESTDPEF